MGRGDNYAGGDYLAKFIGEDRCRLARSGMRVFLVGLEGGLARWEVQAWQFHDIPLIFKKPSSLSGF